MLDLFCGGGGVARGYDLAGFDVIGCDIEAQKHYPYPFVQADALCLLRCLLEGGSFTASNWRRYSLADFAATHTSPPCQGYSACASMQTCQDKDYPKLIEPVRELLRATGKPYVIENVVGAPLECPLRLCGLTFGLKVFRHRLFESNIFLMQPPHVAHCGKQIGKDGMVCVAGHGDSGNGRIPYSHRSVSAWKSAMGIDWMTRDELSQAIPPAYTEFIGRQLIENL